MHGGSRACQPLRRCAWRIRASAEGPRLYRDGMAHLYGIRKCALPTAGRPCALAGPFAQPALSGSMPFARNRRRSALRRSGASQTAALWLRRSARGHLLREGKRGHVRDSVRAVQFPDVVFRVAEGLRGHLRALLAVDLPVDEVLFPHLFLNPLDDGVHPRGGYTE